MQSLSEKVHKLSLVPWIHAKGDWHSAVVEAWAEIEYLIPPSKRKGQVVATVRAAADGFEDMTPDSVRLVIHDLAVWLEGHEGV